MRRVLSVLAVLFVAVGLAWLILGDHEPPPVAPSPAPGPSGAPTAKSKLAGDSQLRVLVIDPKGAPIADAEVACRPASRPTADGAAAKTGEEQISKRTDERGAAAFDLAGGDYVVEAGAAGFLYRSGARASQTVHLAEGGDLDLELVLSRGGTVSGKVVSAGQGIVARVAYHDVSTGTMGQELRSKDDGSFTITGVPPGRVRVHVEAEGAGLTLSPAFDVEDGEHIKGIEIEVAPAGVVVGTLRTVSGDPVAGWVTVDDLTGAAPRRVTAGVDGAFRLDQLRAGSWRLIAQADDFDQATADVEVEPGSETSVDIVLEKAFGVRGTVMRPDGGVPEKAWVQLRTAEQVDAQVAAKVGSYHLEVDPSADAQVVAISPHHADSPLRPASTGEDVALTLGAGGRIEGTVRTPDGQPVKEFELGVETYEDDNNVPYGARSIGTISFVSSDGTYEFGTLRPGRYWLRAVADGYASASAGPIEVRANASAGPLDITLSAGGTVRGRVVTADGGPLARARVQVFDPFSPFATARTRTAADGTFELSGVPSGRRSIRVTARGFLTNVASGLDVTPHSEVTRDVVMERAENGEQFAFGGIGAVLRAEDGAITVQEALKDRPASIFGLKAGDRIMAIDGRSTAELRLGTAVELIRGEEGAAVELELEREGEGRLTVEVERGRVVVESGAAQ